jgi:putative ABC transport system permease protein
MGMRILAGRDFLVDDPSLTSSRWRIGWLGVAVVNETLARRVWPGENPLGKRITFYGGGDWMTVIGVVEDVQHSTLSDRVKDQENSLESRVYFLMYMPRMDLMVHTAGDPNALIEPIREAVLELDPGLPAGAMATLAQLAAESNAAPRFYAQMLGIFAGFALLLTAVGLYGLVAFTVGRRTKEIGLRMALGAHRRDIKKMAMGHAAKSVGLGVAIGVAGSLALARVLENFLFGMDPLDPLTYAAVVLVLAGIAAGASYLPASRASRLDPTDALAYE